MKILLLFAFFISIQAYSESKPEQLEIVAPKHHSENENVFFATKNNFLISNYRFKNNPKNKELDSLESEENLWKEIDVGLLSVIGIQKGSSIQYSNFETGKVSKYIFRDKVKVIMVRYSDWVADPNYRGHNPRNTTFFILLDDVIPKQKDFNFSNQESANGVAYFGSEFKLVPTLENDSIQKIKVDLQDSGIKKIIEAYNLIYKKSFSSEVVETSVSNNYQIFHFSGKNSDGKFLRFLAVDLKNGKYSFLEDENYYLDLKVIEGADWNFITPRDDVGTCDTLHIYKDSKLSSFDFYCMREGC